MSENYDDREKWSDMQLLSQYARGMSTNPKGLFFDSVVASAILRRMSASELLEKKLAIAMMAFDDIETGSYARNIDLKIVKQARSEIAALDTPTAPKSSNSDEDEWEEVELKRYEIVCEGDRLYDDHGKDTGLIARGHWGKHVAEVVDYKDNFGLGKVTRRVPKKKDNVVTKHVCDECGWTGEIIEDLQPRSESTQDEHESKIDRIITDAAKDEYLRLSKAMLDALTILADALGITHHPQNTYENMEKTVVELRNVYEKWDMKETRSSVYAMGRIGEVLKENKFI